MSEQTPICERDDLVQRMRRDIDAGYEFDDDRFGAAERKIVREAVASTRVPPPAAKLHPEPTGLVVFSHPTGSKIKVNQAMGRCNRSGNQISEAEADALAQNAIGDASVPHADVTQSPLPLSNPVAQAQLMRLAGWFGLVVLAVWLVYVATH